MDEKVSKAIDEWTRDNSIVAMDKVFEITKAYAASSNVAGSTIPWLFMTLTDILVLKKDPR